jgi:hypothetical protein
MRLSEQTDAYLIELYVALSRAHVLGNSLIGSSNQWLSLGDRRYYLEFVGNELISRDYALNSENWKNILEFRASQLKEAYTKAEAYATLDNATILDDYYNKDYPHHLWRALTSKVHPQRLDSIIGVALKLENKELLREYQEAFLEMYSDF